MTIVNQDATQRIQLIEESFNKLPTVRTLPENYETDLMNVFKREEFLINSLTEYLLDLREGRAEVSRLVTVLADVISAREK